MKNKDNEIPDCKVTLIGDSGVGKSSIIARYISGIYIKDQMTTSGANYSQKIYEKKGKKVRLNIWDTAGQEKFRALGRNFYTDSYIICMVFDVSKKESFKNIKEIWYPEILQYGEKYKILSVVGNKSDIYEESEIMLEDIKSYVDEIGAKFFLISAESGEGIDEMFKTLANLYLNPDFEDKINASFRSRSKASSICLKNDKYQKKKVSCC
jgi:small GTP-binding protein